VLTVELVERIVTVLATFPGWNTDQVYQHLRQQGVKVTQKQIEQAAEQSGWRKLREVWLERYEMSDTGCHMRDGWLVEQLLAQVQNLLARLEAGLG
jgi:hypothetical protein